MRCLSLVFALCTLALATPAAASAAATPLTQVTRTTGTGVTTSPCTGEPIEFTTTATSVFHFVNDPTGASRISSTVTLGGTATGLTTGTRYVMGGASHTFSPFDPEHPENFPLTGTTSFVMNSAGPAPNLRQHQTIVVHFNAAGEPTVEFNNVTFECVG
jgi:hypothetical protein